MGKPKMRPHRIETPNLIEIKFGTVDYVGEATPGAKFHADPLVGELLGKWVKYTPKIFIYISLYLFSETHLQVRPLGGF